MQFVHLAQAPLPRADPPTRADKLVHIAAVEKRRQSQLGPGAYQPTTIGPRTPNACTQTTPRFLGPKSSNDCGTPSPTAYDPAPVPPLNGSNATRSCFAPPLTAVSAARLEEARLAAMPAPNHYATYSSPNASQGLASLASKVPRFTDPQDSAPAVGTYTPGPPTETAIPLVRFGQYASRSRDAALGPPGILVVDRDVRAAPGRYAVDAADRATRRAAATASFTAADRPEYATRAGPGPVRAVDARAAAVPARPVHAVPVLAAAPPPRTSAPPLPWLELREAEARARARARCIRLELAS